MDRLNSSSGSNPKMGLLPLYLELYDKVVPELRPRIEGFVKLINEQFVKRGMSVMLSPICRVGSEFRAAIEYFEKEDVDAIVTLHLAYSPSLESAQLLSKTRLPLIILDTTPFFELVSSQDTDAIMLNHGIHGVQDLCNVLLRFGKNFVVEVGHWGESDVLDRVSQDVRAARIARFISKSKVGSIGGPFEGMGDFLVEHHMLKNKIGLDVINSEVKDIVSFLPESNSSEVNYELEYLLKNYDCRNLEKDSLIKSVRAGIAVRNWIKRNRLNSFTMNFTKFNRSCGLPTIPFLETEICLAKGLGYAGEGDVITSAFIGALNSVYSEVTFTEMFCPDWKENIIFLSHMGEVNIDLFAQKAVLKEKDLPFLDIDSPVIGVGKLKSGKAVLANLAPLKESFHLIISLGEMVDVEDEKNFSESIRGWFRPQIPIIDFLTAFSQAGGTHHSALIYGGESIAREIAIFGKMMGWDVTEL
ncbi:MAG: hypothetical protein H5T85_05285 [Actinobacteria bacterium]|nr:hypothetical protein [Actinomycetota bacterium]